MSRSDVLDMANESVIIRGNHYGEPADNFRRIATLWNAYLSIRPPGPITPTDVAHMMILVKQARLMATPNHPDSWVDMAGYAACGGEISTAPGAGPVSPGRAPDEPDHSIPGDMHR